MLRIQTILNMKQTKNFLARSACSSLLFVAAVGLIQPAHAQETLANALSRILKEHPLMGGVDNDVATAREQLGVEASSWLPRLGYRQSLGSQDVQRDASLGASGTYSPNDISLTLNQLLWDFGATGTAIERARKNLSKEELERATQRINLVLAGIDAHLKLLKATQQLEYANKSEANIKKHAQFESLRTEAGKGLTTDVLQAKMQLAGAQARRVGAQGALAVAHNRYRAVFGERVIPAMPTAVQEPAPLPASEQETLRLIESSNPDVLAARARSELKAAERDAVQRKEWAPRIDLQAEVARKSDVDGSIGTRNDGKIMLQMAWNFELGNKARHSTDAASYAAASESDKASYTLMQAQEEGRNAWADLVSARARLAFLLEQVKNAKQFLELARQERELGRRSLLDVLQGETSLINAQSDVVAAQTDVVLAAFRMLRATGTLDVSHVSEQPVMALAVLPSAPVAALPTLKPALRTPEPSAPTAVVVEPAIKLAAVEKAAAATLTIEQSTTLNALARRLYPGDRVARDGYRRLIADANPVLFAGVSKVGALRLAKGTQLLLAEGVPR